MVASSEVHANTRERHTVIPFASALGRATPPEVWFKKKDVANVVDLRKIPNSGTLVTSESASYND